MATVRECVPWIRCAVHAQCRGWAGASRQGHPGRIPRPYPGLRGPRWTLRRVKLVGIPPGRTALTGDGGASPAARAAAEFRSQTRSRDPGREPWWVDRVAPLSPAVRHLSTPAALEPTASLLVSRRPRRLSGSGVADPGFCSWSAARLSGSPRAGFSVGDEPEAGLAPTTRPGSSPRGAGSSRCELPLRPIVSKNSASTRFPVLAMSRELQVPGVAPAFALLPHLPSQGLGSRRRQCSGTRAVRSRAFR